MRHIFFIIFTFLAVFAVSYWYNNSAHICPAPIEYRVGDVDERFGLSESEVKQMLSRAESLWETAVERELFVYDEDSDFLVNFIFDERQQLVWTEEEWRISLDEKEKAGQKLLDKVEQMSDEYEEKSNSYNNKRSEYESSLVAYNQKVEELNKKGGAPPDLYEELQEEQKELARGMENLMEIERELNDLSSDINTLGKEANEKIEEYNKGVREYNEMFGNRDIYTQGDFKRERINIYKFSDEEEVVKVMAHEFGHALGIEHVEDNQAIMYYLMEEQANSLALTNQDKQALLESCGDGTEFSHNVRSIIRNLVSHF